MKTWAWVLGGVAAVSAGVFAIGRWGRGATIDAGFWQRALEAFGGRTVDPSSYEYTTSGLQLFLFDSRVGPEFSAADIVTPHNPAMAAIMGLSRLNPGRRWWPRTAALIRLANVACQDIVADADIRNHWRPEPYNTQVGGEEDSAHIEAMAVDIDFDSTNDRALAERVLRGIQAQHGWLHMGLGLGLRTIHLDILTGKPQRPNIWCYTGYDCDRRVG
ncbi:MAG: hypothetical protein ACYTG0_12680 [Planctomycetota bacterium]|jgi:hypothetical protein